MNTTEIKIYTLEQLGNPETYKTDKGLFGMARTIAEEKFSDRTQMLAFRDEIVAGKHAEVVHGYRVNIVREQVAAFELRNANIETAKAVVPPAGVTITVNEETDKIYIATPWDGYDIAPRIKRLGGRWDADTKIWIVPMDAAGSLKRVFANWQKSQGEKAKIQAAANAEKERQKAATQRQREAQWAAEREADRRAREAQKQAQAKAIGERVRVVAGRYKIGDTLNGKAISGFGKSWTESDLSKGQLYQPCADYRCDNEPACVDCERCSKHCTCGTQTNYCYAYFS